MRHDAEKKHLGYWGTKKTTTNVQMIWVARFWGCFLNKKEGDYQPIPTRKEALCKLRSKRHQTQQSSPNRRLEKWVKPWQGDSYETSLHQTKIH